MTRLAGFAFGQSPSDLFRDLFPEREQGGRRPERLPWSDRNSTGLETLPWRDGGPVWLETMPWRAGMTAELETLPWRSGGGSGTMNGLGRGLWP